MIHAYANESIDRRARTTKNRRNIICLPITEHIQSSQYLSSNIFDQEVLVFEKIKALINYMIPGGDSQNDIEESNRMD